MESVTNMRIVLNPFLDYFRVPPRHEPSSQSRLSNSPPLDIRMDIFSALSMNSIVTAIGNDEFDLFKIHLLSMSDYTIIKWVPWLEVLDGPAILMKIAVHTNPVALFPTLWKYGYLLRLEIVSTHYLSPLSINLTV
jgi:hypothetical protein